MIRKARVVSSGKKCAYTLINTSGVCPISIAVALGDSPRAYVSALGYLATAGLAMWGFGRGRDPHVIVTIGKSGGS
ncbi:MULTISPECIES: hypothetical protein [Corynebacterium]|nr:MULTISPECIES: hypothetical protein [Corynebacterium]QJS14900.1 hypothetical protein HK412_00565 [Corynebacterium glutamicum]QXU46203.1 hypothetical protein KW808_02535 [[Brevibacterium] flavum]